MTPIRASLPPIVLLLAVGSLLFPVSGTDDKYITYWAAHALATFGEIVNYNGERVEQSSSLTQVLLLAALAKATPWSMSALGWAVSLVFGLATVLMTYRLAGRIEPSLAQPAAWIAGSALSLVYWSFGGLESTLAAFLGVWLVVIGLDAIRHGFPPGRTLLAAIATLLFVAVRPEAAFLASAVWLGIAALPLLQRVTRVSFDPSIDRDTVRRTAALLLLTITAFAAVALFRFVYFGDIFPQPVRAKVGNPAPGVVRDGLRYLVLEPLERWDVLWLVALGGVALVSYRTLRRVPPGLPLTATSLLGLAQAGFVVLTGGDWMGGGRFLVPAVPVAAIFAARLLAALRHSPRIWIAGLVFWQVLACVDFTRRVSASGPLWAHGPPLPLEYRLTVDWFDLKNRTHVHFMPATAELEKVLASLPMRTQPRVTILSGQMGFVPYQIARAFYGRVEFIDIGGLTTRHVTELTKRHPFPKESTGVQLWYSDLFALMRSGETLPWLPPDVIVDYELAGGHDAARQQRAEAHGYAVLFRQEGFPDNGSRTLPGGVRTRNVFLAARRDLARGPTVEYRFLPRR